ncbi:MAG: biotin synthase BioB [bacterium]|nr:biotin synthase BioB [bacterium]
MKIKSFIDKIEQKLSRGIDIGRVEAAEIVSLIQKSPFEIHHLANKIREKYFSDKINLCGIANIKSGNCSEDCKYCAQSGHNSANVKTYPLVEENEMLEGARRIKGLKASRYGLITSGCSIEKKSDLLRIISAVKRISNEIDIKPCASLGELTDETCKMLKDAGITRYHHNLETSERFFKEICTTHTWADRVKTVKIVKKYGLQACSGGIFGMGETWDDRLDLAFSLRELEVDSIPLNFLNPIPGTPLEKQPPLEPMEILNIISIFRIILPSRDIKVCGGREKNLRQLQSWIFYAGASGMMIGNYLTTAGRPHELDWEMIEDLGLEVNL